jgi:hypothetical protein
LRSHPLLGVLFTSFMRLLHHLRLDVGPFLAWEDTTPCFEASISLLQGNVEILHQIGPSFRETSPCDEGFMYMWHVLLIYDLFSFIVWMTSHFLLFSGANFREIKIVNNEMDIEASSINKGSRSNLLLLLDII